MKRLEVGCGDSPLGPLTAVSDGEALIALSFERLETLAPWLQRVLGEWTAIPSLDPAGVVSALDRYFAGELHALDAVPVRLFGTRFQVVVWRALRDIPAGRTCSYAALAGAVGTPKAVRAVGAANGRNPVALVLPCHRVIGSDGTLTGYGGGLERKEWLLRHERAEAASGQRSLRLG